MRVPEGIDDGEYAGKVLNLDRALYGLKQAGPRGGHTHYIALYVDDLLIVSPALNEIQQIKDGLKATYPILGEAKFIFQVHCRSHGGIFLSHCAHLEDVLLRLATPTVEPPQRRCSQTCSSLLLRRTTNPPPPSAPATVEK
ncbi:hypothetical protein JCM8115_000846, partial [Rhodotorula mucilaginosa]